MRSRYVILSLLLPLSSSIALSAAAEDYVRPGPYVRGGATFSWENSANLAEARDFFVVTGSTDTFYGGEGALGWRVHPYFAVEAEFEYLGSATTKVDVPQTVDAAEIELWNVSGNARLYPLGGMKANRFQPFASIGLGYGKAEITWTPAALAAGGGFLENASDGGFVVKVGGGLDVYLTEVIALYVDGNYIFTTGDIEDNDVGSVGAGAMLRF